MANAEPLALFPRDEPPRAPYAFRVGGLDLETTPVFDLVYTFAAERQRMFFRRLRGDMTALTRDRILAHHRFTNTYRASDRVSQYLINNVIPESPADAESLLTRILLFKIFNRIPTWVDLERNVGPIAWPFDRARINFALNVALDRGEPIFSPAYVMPTPSSTRAGEKRKHGAFLDLIEIAIAGGLATRIADAHTLGDVYHELRAIPFFGPFLAYQYAIDINYSSLTNFSENDFVVAGPGALNGLAKAFTSTRSVPATEIIMAMTERASDEFARLNIVFPDLFGRPIHLIDLQNLLCETDKAARLIFPQLSSRDGRHTIKQKYRANASPILVNYPAKWGLIVRNATSTAVPPL